MKIKIKFYILIMFIYFLIMPNIVNAVEELPDNGAKISSSQVIQTKTGTGPWDDNDEPGNDSSESNNIVRSFDQVTWTIENTMVLNSSTADSYTGGKIYFEAKLPDIFNNNLAKWDLDSMKWITNAKISSDGLTITGYYQMSQETVTIPGKQTLVFIAKLFGVANNTEFSPKIKVWLNGNSSELYSNIEIENVRVSSYPKYNLVLVKNSFAKKVSVELDGENVDGRLHGYGLGISLYNDTAEKGLKGIEYPQGDITFELTSKVEKMSIKNISNIEDITSKCTPKLYDYKINIRNTKGILGKDMNFGNDTYSFAFFSLPIGKTSSIEEQIFSVYNSGNVEMRQENEKIYVTVKNYQFNGIFPQYKGRNPQPGDVPYSDNIGFFSTLYFQIVVPYNEFNLDENYNYYVTLSNNNFSATSLSGEKTNAQMIKSDDTNRVQNVIYSPGSYYEGSRIYSLGNYSISQPYYAGNAFMCKKDGFYYWADTRADPKNDDDSALYTFNKLVKFDGDAFKPLKLSNSYYKARTAEFTGESYTYKMWFVTKKDGTNWTSQQEMNNADIEDLILYENIEDIPDNYICVGEYFENQSGYLVNGYVIVYVQLEVKDSAKVGSTYGMTQRTKGWNEALDRNIYTASNPNVEWPNTTYDSLNRNYIKTEYDENGTQISGTHNGGQHYGQSVLILGAYQRVALDTIDNAGNKKTNYDLGKNENVVTFKVTPSLTLPANNKSNISGVTVKVEDTIDNGLTYIPGSSNYGEPEIIENDDGSSTLIWYIYNCTVGKIITPLTFNASIYDESANGTQYESTVVISSDNNLVGNARVDERTNKTSIQIINLSSHRLYKVDKTPVIEKNGEIHFTLSYKNNTDDTIPDFQLLDILPYNGDGRGTEFTGTYTLDRVVVSKEDANVSRAVGDMQVLYTNDESVRSATSKDENLGSGWTEVTSENIKQNAIAIVVKGEVEAQGKVNVDVYLKTSDNKGLDKYVNSATAQVYKATEEMTTSNVVSQVVERKIEGIAWKDVNANGVKDENEEVLQNIELTLTDSLGNQVMDVNGNIVESVRTDNNGYYKFANLPKGNYYISVAIFNSDYEITEKETGTNSQINSKFNVEAKETDEITKLNSIDLPILTMSNVNVGFVKKATSIVIKHVTEEGENLVEPQTVEGRIGDKYETQDRASEFKEYELKTTPSNASGTMQAEQIEVVYVYSLVKGKITITKVDKTDEMKTLSGATFKVEKLNEDNTIDTTFTAIEKTTEESGIAEFTDLLVGKYRITETKAPQGYELSKNTIDVEITKEQRELNVKATDRLKLILPKTGGEGSIIFIISGIILMSLVLILKNIKLMKVKK